MSYLLRECVQADDTFARALAAAGLNRNSAYADYTAEVRAAYYAKTSADTRRLAILRRNL